MSLSRAHRIRRKAAYDRVYGDGTSAADRRIRVIAVRNDIGLTRLGLTVGRRWGSAVRRNRIRRVIREAFRAVLPELPAGLDVVVLPRRGADRLTVAGVRDSLGKLVAKVDDRLDPREASACAGS